MDFKLYSVNDTITSGDFYHIEMNSITNNELPLFTTDYAELYIQSVAILATVNKGQLTEYTSKGITPRYKRLSQSPDVQGRIYQIKVLEELADMVMTLLQNNYGLLDYALKNEADLQVAPNFDRGES